MGGECRPCTLVNRIGDNPENNALYMESLVNSREVCRRGWLALMGVVLVLAALCYPAPGKAQAADQDYVLGIGDSLNIQVFGEPDLSFESLPVVDDGQIVMPLIGEIVVAGISVRDAQSEIRRRLADGYLINPAVTVTVASYRPLYVVGEVRNPGKVAFTPGMSVRNAIVLAGGTTERGDESRIIIERAIQGNQRFPADLSSEVRPGDTINIGRYETFAVRGGVQFPETLRYQTGINLRRAIDLAGGFTADADNGNIKLERNGSVHDVRDRLDSVVIEPGDVLTIGILSRQEKEQDKLFVFVQGEVSRGGRYEFADGMTVEKAIVLAGGFSERASRRRIDIRRDGNPPVMLRRVDLTDSVLPGDIITVGASIF
jgi:polysaccharide biosynthesis/export protein VpsN